MHKRIACKSCGIVIMQCRCSGPHTTEYRLCDRCETKGKLDA